jgi:Holliday junction DNA helicase RuvA
LAVRRLVCPTTCGDRLNPGDLIFLHTCLIVRQESLALYGFDTREEREYFTLLLSVDGVGPKLALSMLSVLTPEAIRRMVYQEQPELFTRVPGVGKKTAQKIFLQLQDRLPASADMDTQASEVDPEVCRTNIPGIQRRRMRRHCVHPARNSQDTEERLRLALRYFG